jgi:hypothetical protein
MSKWFVQIAGDKFDLEDLPNWFNSSGLTVVQEADGYYMHSSHFDLAKDSNEVRDLAEKLAEKMLGAARLFRPDFQPVKLGAVVKENEAGGKDIHISVSDSIIGRNKGRASITFNGVEQKPSTPKPALWLNVAQNYEKVAHALRIWGKGPHDWINLYKILEIIESDVGGKIYQERWISKPEVTRFTQTANSAEALGDAARHAKKRIPPPPKPMTIQEAQHLIRELLKKWTESKKTSL